MECSQYILYAELKNYGQLYLYGCVAGADLVCGNFLNQTDRRADTTAKGFIWANISTSTTSLLQRQSYVK